MKQLFSITMIALALASSALLSGCNTWQGAKQDAKDTGHAVTHAVGTGLDKAGEGLSTAGEKVKDAGSQDDDKAQ
ncbi:MAG: entericidin EcnAB [Burkholderiaceae bacterium]|nr:entericidin EcnAB [Burkholderiaceae bacterium]